MTAQEGEGGGGENCAKSGLVVVSRSRGNRAEKSVFR